MIRVKNPNLRLFYGNFWMLGQNYYLSSALILILSRRGFDPGTIALLMGTTIIPVFFARSLSGRLSDRGNRKRVAILAFLPLGVCLCFYSMSHTMEAWSLFILRLVHGFLQSYASTALQAALVAINPRPEVRKRVTQVNGAVGFSSVPIAAGMSFVSLFISPILWGFVIGVAVLSVVPVLQRMPDINQPQKSGGKKSGKSYSEVFKSTAPWGIGAFCIAIIHGGATSLISLYAEGLQLGTLSAWIFLSFYGGAIILMRLWRFVANQRVTFSYITLTSTGIGLALLGFFPGVYSIILAAVLIGAGYTITHHLFQNTAYDQGPKERAGAISGLYMSFYDFGLSTAGLYSYVAYEVGYDFMWIFMIPWLLVPLMIVGLQQHKGRLP